MDKITLKAPAKINLFLKVLKKLPDGYHRIETLFEKIALFDRIRLQKTPKGISLYSKNRDLPKGSKNLAYQAAALMKARYKIPLGVKIEIEKSIPIGSGLGGGSSDAAAVLIGINRLYNLGLSKERLRLLAKELGADVPFFVSDKVWATGRQRGDRIEGIDTRMILWHILIIPPFSILSKDAYEWVDGNSGRRREGPKIDRALSALKQNDVKLLGKNLYNDLEGLSLERKDALKKLKDELIEYGANGAMISGSGPALFGITRQKEEVIRLKKKIEERVATKNGSRWQVLVVPTFYNE